MSANDAGRFFTYDPRRPKHHVIDGFGADWYQLLDLARDVKNYPHNGVMRDVFDFEIHDLAEKVFKIVGDEKSPDFLMDVLSLIVQSMVEGEGDDRS